MMSKEEFDEFLELLEEAEANANTDWEQEFVADMQARAEQYGRSIFVSDRQMEILRELAG